MSLGATIVARAVCRAKYFKDDEPSQGWQTVDRRIVVVEVEGRGRCAYFQSSGTSSNSAATSFPGLWVPLYGCEWSQSQQNEDITDELRRAKTLKQQVKALDRLGGVCGMWYLVFFDKPTSEDGMPGEWLRRVYGARVRKSSQYFASRFDDEVQLEVSRWLASVEDDDTDRMAEWFPYSGGLTVVASRRTKKTARLGRRATLQTPAEVNQWLRSHRVSKVPEATFPRPLMQEYAACAKRPLTKKRAAEIEQHSDFF